MKKRGNMYQSPIEIIYGQVEMEFENNVMQAVQKYGINVNKDDLISALMYDRHQYEKGYQDCKKEYKHSLTFDEIREIVLGIESQEPEIQLIKGLILGSVAKKISEKNSDENRA